MMDLYDQHTAAMRLQGCVIRVGGDPVYVDRVEQTRGGKFRVQYHVLGIDQHHIIQWGDEAIDPSPVPLGYINYHNKNVISVDRTPERQWKIGLTTHNMRLGGLNDENGVRRDIKSRIINSRPLARAIKGEYPSLVAAKRKLREVPEVAISRDFMIHTNGKLIHRIANIVGEAAPRLKLHDQHFYLKETLEQLQ